MNGDGSQPSQPTLRRRLSQPSHSPRPSSSCIDAFRRQKLRYAEALKRHLIDDVDNSRKDSKKRHVSSTDKRRPARPLSVNGAVCSRTEPTRRNSRPKSCSRCSKTFSCAAELQKHAASHGSTNVATDATPYKCPLCSQTFQTRECYQGARELPFTFDVIHS
uniref:C2H2-type domain-containing protein n=1 Tax=Ixodes ricinus TaxID=34613 RepID=A0A090XAA7_IXORI